MVIGDGNPVFLDTNILVYANVSESPFHQSAIQKIQSLYNTGIDLWISRQVLREFLVTLTRPQAFVNPFPSGRCANGKFKNGQRFNSQPE